MLSRTHATTDPFALAARGAALELAGVAGFESTRQRLEKLPSYVRRCGDVLADILEEAVAVLGAEAPAVAAGVSVHLVDVLLAEEGFSRRFWKAFRLHLRLLQEAGRHHEAESRLRETLRIAAAFG